MRANILLLLLAPLLAAAQCEPPINRAWIEFRDNGTCVDTLWFGCDPSATCGLDSALCEIELPPAPPSGVCDVRWVDIPGHHCQDSTNGLGLGSHQNYLPCSFPGHIDTFRIKFQPGDGGFPVTFRWTLSDVVGLCDSAIIIDEFGGFLVKARMNVVSMVQVTNPAFFSLRLLVYGMRALVEGAPPGEGLPAGFALAQCYPNPFNPSTTLKYALPVRLQITLRVFNTLGQEIATLVNEIQEAGYHSAEWNAGGVASGVYFYRLQAGDFVQTRKMVLLR
jgi:hypothetical protein